MKLPSLSNRFLRWFLVTAGIVLLASGCGEPPRPGLVTVRGRVWYQGRPLPTGTVVFTPDSRKGCQGPLARAEIQPDGTFFLRTGDLPGAAAGSYRVTVLAVETPSAAAPGQKYPMPRSLLPEKYSDPDLSDLSCDIRAGQDNGFNFHLE